MGLDTMVLQMYAQGMSTRDIARGIENMDETTFSPTAVSRSTHLVTKEVRMGQKRRCRSHYRFVYLDATFISYPLFLTQTRRFFHGWILYLFLLLRRGPDAGGKDVPVAIFMTG